MVLWSIYVGFGTAFSTKNLLKKGKENVIIKVRFCCFSHF